MFTEDMAPKRPPRTGFAKDSVEVEGYVRGFARRRPDVSVTILRVANVVGPTAVTPMTQYFRLPVIPTVLGFDPRMQLLHEDDLVAVLRLAAMDGAEGTFNVAGDGVLVLSQAMRRLGRPSLPVPGFAASSAGSLVRRTGLADFSPEQVAFLTHGRGVDTTRMRDLLGFTPAHTTESALADLRRAIGPGPITEERVARLEERVGAAIGTHRG